MNPKVTIQKAPKIVQPPDTVILELSKEDAELLRGLIYHTVEGFSNNRNRFQRISNELGDAGILAANGVFFDGRVNVKGN